MNRVKAKAENKTQYIIDLIESDLDQRDIVGPTEIESQDKKKVLYDIPEGEIVGLEEIEKYY